MSCYYPLEGFQPVSGGRVVFSQPTHTAFKKLSISCGQCIGCRISKSDQWTLRMIHEASLWSDNQFLTLTYSDENLPANNSLQHRHFQLFMKRLRERLEPRKLRFFMCGEYGSKKGRPHYHAIIFNLPLDDLTPWRKSKGYMTYRSPFLDEIWKHGDVYVGESVTADSCGYVSQYVLKNGHTDTRKDLVWLNPQTGERVQRAAPYIQMSRQPGLGNEFFNRFWADMYPDDFALRPVRRKPPKGLPKTERDALAASGSSPVRLKPVRVPAYYDRLLKKSNPDLWDEIQEKRMSALRDPKVIAERSPERLRVREAITIQQLKLKETSL